MFQEAMHGVGDRRFITPDETKGEMLSFSVDAVFETAVNKGFVPFKTCRNPCRRISSIAVAQMLPKFAFRKAGDVARLLLKCHGDHVFLRSQLQTC